MTNTHDKTGVLLVNLGTPSGTDYWSMRRYLAEFLSDKRVIEAPRLFWYPLLHGIILSVRPQKSGANYRRIWNTKQDESPLRTFTREQSENLARRLHDDAIIVDWAMRYGTPSIEDVTNKMIKQGCTRIVMFPLYPQYSATTTATVCDMFFAALKKHRFMPAIRTVPAYPDDPIYIEALANAIEQHLTTLNFTPERIIASFHGIPQSYVKRGDPYENQCLRTVQALRKHMDLDENRLMMTFQSRFGPQEWLQPYTDETVASLGKSGIRSIAVLNPGFVSDCLETVDEIGREVAEEFFANGGHNFSHIPCLNASDNGMRVIEHLVRQELAHWI